MKFPTETCVSDRYPGAYGAGGEGGSDRLTADVASWT